MPFEQIGPVKLDAVVNVRLTPDEKADLVQQAADASLSVSELVRRRALGRRVDTSLDRTAINELRRLGGLFKHAFANGADKAQTGAALQAVREAIERLAR